ncbi:MAG TPA: DUF3078 domain-containing protein [Cyclobacteriaceae bacterium]|nr:DUF3078 domain-containing protein [Cyclobacteriaceae bacterium]
MNQKFTPVYCLIIVFVLIFGSASAQIVKEDTLTNWKKAFKAGLNLNQAAFSSNWKAGGVNSFGFTALMNYKANYKKGNTSWDNEIDMLYGMVNNQGQGYRKTLDRIFLDTKVGHSINKKWDFFFAMNAVSQFAKGYKYVKDVNGVEQPQLISDALAPAFITATIGAEYHPADFFKVRFSPIAPRATILGHNDGRYSSVDPLKPYGVEVGSSTRFEWYAFQMMAEFNKDIATNINLKWRYVMFANYETLEAKKIDHRVDLNLTAKVNRFVNVSLGGIFLYDYDQDASAQYSQAFSLGILYTIQNFAEKK